MEPKANPVCKRGERNIYCPIYSDCLDQVVNQFWQHWSCTQCPYRKIKSFDEIRYSVNSEEQGQELLIDIVEGLR